MDLEEFERTGYWSNEEYFDYMKETGNWREDGDLGITGKPCDRCGYDELGSWKVEAYLHIDDESTDSYSVVTGFEICLLCMVELYGSLDPEEKEAIEHGMH